MHHTFRRRAAVTAAAVLAGLTVVPLTATPALAVVAPVERAFFTADTDGDGFSGLYWKTTPNGTPQKVFEDAGHDAYSLSSSQDGTRIAYVQDTFTSAGAPVREQVVVRDVSTRLVRVVSDRPFDGVRFDSLTALSPDGSTVVWDYTDTGTGAVSVRKAAVASGGVTTLAAGYSPYGFVSPTSVLIQNVAGDTWTIPVTGGALTTAAGIPVDAFYVRVSPDGSKVAWARMTSSNSPRTSVIEVAPLTFPSGHATAGTATTIATGLYNTKPSWSRDGTTVYFIRNAGTPGAAGDIWSAPADASTAATATAATAANENGVAITSTDDGTAPGDATPQAATLLGTSATLRWTLPADTDLSGVIVTRSLNGAVTRTAYVPAPLTAWTDTGLTAGSTYTYGFQTVDRSNNVGTVVTRQLTAVQAKPTAASPTSTSFTRAPFTVRFATSAVPSGVTFDVYYRANSASTWTHWVSSVAGVARTFGSPAASGVAATTSYPGVTYQFRVTARDAFGNSTPVAIGTPSVVPFDQTKASFNAGTTYAVSSAWLGSYRVIKTAGSYARVSLTGNQLTVIGTRCKACGVFDLYDGTRLIRTVDTYAATTVPRAVLFSVAYTTSATHTFTLRARGTAGRPNVVLDGFGMRR